LLDDDDRPMTADVAVTPVEAAHHRRVAMRASLEPIRARLRRGRY
jgi:hypothetical protein